MTALLLILALIGVFSIFTWLALNFANKSQDNNKAYSKFKVTSTDDSELSFSNSSYRSLMKNSNHQKCAYLSGNEWSDTVTNPAYSSIPGNIYYD